MRLYLTVTLDVQAPPGSDAEVVATKALKRALRAATRRHRADAGITNYAVRVEHADHGQEP